MKKIQIILLFACLSFACCDPGEVSYYIRFRPRVYTFEKEGGEITMKLENPIFRNYKIYDIGVLPWYDPDSLVYELSEEERIELSLDLEKDKSWYKITKLANGDLHVWVDKNNKNYDRSIIVCVENFGDGYAIGGVIIRQRK